MKSLLITLALLVAPSAWGFHAKLDSTIDTHVRAEVAKLQSLKGTPVKTIRILIDTPGGRIDILNEIHQVVTDLKAEGKTVDCFIRKAYSAGFLLANACSERYACPQSTFMWHEGWFYYSGPISFSVAAQFMLAMLELQTEVDKVARETFKTTDEVFEYLKSHEVIFTAPEANHYSPGWITILPKSVQFCGGKR